MSVDEACAIISRGAETAANAKQALAELESSLAAMKRQQASAAEASERAGALTSSFDAKWEEFKKKFDDLNKQAIAKIAGVMGGTATNSLRPAEYISEARVAQVLRRARRLVVLTGAGISAESGIPTFRGSDGFWTVGSQNYQPQELATWSKFNEMPEELWRWYQYRWGICRSADPNPGHFALVELEGLVDGGMTLVTQNIDGLHLLAGSNPERLCELHGRIDEMRCDERVEGACLHGLSVDDPENLERARATVCKTPKPSKNEGDERLPHCSRCGVRQRPKILWFDECYNEAFYKYKTVIDATRNCDVLFIIGTMLTTGGPSRMVAEARSAGSIIIRVDPIVDLTESSSAGMLHLQGKSGEVLPRIVEQLRALREEPLLAPLAQPPYASPLATPALRNSTRAAAAPASPASASLRQSALKAAAAPKAAATKAAAAPAQRGSARTRASSNPAALVTQKSISPPGTPATTATTPSRRGSKAVAPTRPSRRSSSTTAMARNGNSGSLAAAASLSLARGNASDTLVPLGKATPSSSLAAASPKTATEGAADGFFVYGTLRPDDDSGASWTKAFCEGMHGEVAFLGGASLYVDGRFPAVSFEQTQFSVRGALLTPNSKDAAAVMAAKLEEADRIENYPELYDRAVATVWTASGMARRAYVYHRTGRTDRSECVCIADGDWMSRKRA